MPQFEYIVIGAGPAGLQMGHLLSQAQRSYVILEAGDTAGSFFVDQPRHGMLLSINKRFNGFPEKEFNLRHDWNSLLSDDDSLLFKNYSDKLLPTSEELLNYLRDFAKKLDLNIQYNTRVTSISRNDDSRFTLKDASDNIYSCDCLLMATGAVSPRIPTDIEGIEHADGYEDHSLDTSEYENKKVAIIGRGNSAFEVADHLAGHAAMIHLIVGVPVKHAWQTHHPGDLRAVNNNILDMYQLKSMHATIGFCVKKISKQPEGGFQVVMEEDYPHWDVPATGTTTMSYDRIIRCTGWNYIDGSIFEEGCVPEMDAGEKYPELSATWESSVPGLYYLGAAMKSCDRKTTSAFIHGFRYNVRTLFHLLEERHHGVPLPRADFTFTNATDLDKLADFIIQRASVTSALFQLFGYFCDALVISDGNAKYYYELSVDQVLERDDFAEQEHLFLVTLEYGFHKYPKTATAIDFIHPADASNTSCAAYLHPILRYYSRGKFVEEVHLGESLVVRYDHYDYDENFENTHKNSVKNLLNRKVPVTEEVYYDKPFPPGVEEKVLTRWSKEKIRKWEDKQVQEEAECKFLV